MTVPEQVSADWPRYDDGTVRLVNADCIAAFRELPDESIDLVLTDPPYGMGYQSNRRPRETRFDRIVNDEAFDPEFNAAWLREAFRVLRDGTHAYVFTDDGNLGNWRAALAAVGFTVKRSLVWHKGGGGIGDLVGDYMHETEFVVFAHKGRRPLNGRRESNLRLVQKVTPGLMDHPTQKPTSLLIPLIEKSTDPGGVILDPFIGSGTTAVAARTTGRKCVGFEIDRRYFDVAVARVAQRSLLEEGA